MDDRIKERRRSKDELLREVLAAGGRPAKRNTFHCFQHEDRTASSWIKQSKEGFWYFRCFTCDVWYDVWDLEARNKNTSVVELFRALGAEPVRQQQYYATIEELIDSIDHIAVEEINPYTNPATGNADLLVVRYLPRGGARKAFAQAYQTPRGFIKRRPPGQLPLFNRLRLGEADEVVFVEGEKVVRALTRLGFAATTGAGGASNASAHDYSPLAGKRVYLWADNDEPGRRYMEQVRDRLLELAPAPTIFMVTAEGLGDGGDAADLIEMTTAEGGTDEDCRAQIECLLADASESKRLEGFEELLDDMREGRRENLPLAGFPILTSEAMTLLNQQVSVLYGNAGFGKTLMVGKICDDLAIAGCAVARLQLEDDLPKHLLRTFAQQAGRAELTKPEFHKQQREESRRLYAEYQPVLDLVAATIVADEMTDWNVASIIEWVGQQLGAGKKLIVIDPASVVMTDKVWLDSHRLMWGIKKLLRQHPQGRVLLVTHPNAEGEVSGGQAFKRFCHNLLVLTRFKQPKQVVLLRPDGVEETCEVPASVGIVKTRDGSGSGLEIAVRLNPETICIEELGIILREVKETKGGGGGGYTGRDLERENAQYKIKL